MKILNRSNPFGAASVMIGSFVAALVSALGHHAFYQSLDNKQISHTAFTQNVNTAGGTTFAYLVRAFMAFAAATAYSQVLWKKLLRRQLTVRTIDSLSSLLTSITELFDVRHVRHHPVLLVLALASWLLIPVSTILPPATLSVHSRIQSNVTLQAVRTLDWTQEILSTPYRSCLTVSGHLKACVVEGGYELTMLANSVATQGRILPIHMAMNTSYRIGFEAPSLNCRSVDSPTLGKMSTNCANPNHDDIPVGYMSWSPRFPSNNSSDGVPGVHSGHSIDVDCNKLAPAQQHSDFSYWQGSDAHFFVATWRQTAMRAYYGRYNDVGNWEVLKCSLQRAEYTVELDLNEAAQTIHIVDKKLLDYSILQLRPSINLARRFSSEQHRTLSFLTIMSVMRQITAGTIVEGALSMLKAPAEGAYLYGTPFFDQPYFQWWVKTIASFSPYDPPARVPPQALLAAALEELFQNITLSLLSDDRFTVSKNVKVTSWGPQLVYAYSWKHLVASYGGGLLVTLLVLAVGYAALHENRASFSNKFSTFLRAANPGDLQAFVAEGAFNGADPLPKAVAMTKIRFGPSQFVSKSTDDTEKAGFIPHAVNADSVENARHISAGSGASEQLDEDTVSPTDRTEDGDMA